MTIWMLPENFSAARNVFEASVTIEDFLQYLAAATRLAVV